MLLRNINVVQWTQQTSLVYVKSDGPVGVSPTKPLKLGVVQLTLHSEEKFSNENVEIYKLMSILVLIIEGVQTWRPSY